MKDCQNLLLCVLLSFTVAFSVAFSVAISVAFSVALFLWNVTRTHSMLALWGNQKWSILTLFVTLFLQKRSNLTLFEIFLHHFPSQSPELWLPAKLVHQEATSFPSPSQLSGSWNRTPPHRSRWPSVLSEPSGLPAKNVGTSRTQTGTRNESEHRKRTN